MNILCPSNSYSKMYGTEPRYHDPRYNDIPDITMNILCPGKSYSKVYGTEPRYNDLRYNDIPDITMNILCPGKSYSKVYGTEPRYNDLRYNDIPDTDNENLADRTQNLPRYNDIISSQSQFKQIIEFNSIT